MEVQLYQGELNRRDKIEALVLLDAKKKDGGFIIPELGKELYIEYGEEFRYVMVWPEQGQDFVCLKPWIAKTKELNRKDDLYFLLPKQWLQTIMSIRVSNELGEHSVYI